MNRRKQSLVFIALCLVCLVSGCASSHRYMIVEPPTTALNNYTTLEIQECKSNLQEEDAIKVAEEIPDMIVDALANYNKNHPDAMLFSEVVRASDQTAQVLVMENVLVSYEKGSQAARYFVGMGAGKAYCTIQSRFVDKSTGEQVLKANFEGELSGGFFGGEAKDSAKGVVSSIIDYLKKNY